MEMKQFEQFLDIKKLQYYRPDARPCAFLGKKTIVQAVSF